LRRACRCHRERIAVSAKNAGGPRRGRDGRGFIVVGDGAIIKHFNETPPVRSGEGTGSRPLLGKFWHKIPDLDSVGTRSLDGNGGRKRTFVALYGRISYQMHRASQSQKNKRSPSEHAALSLFLSTSLSFSLARSRLSHAKVHSSASLKEAARNNAAAIDTRLQRLRFPIARRVMSPKWIMSFQLDARYQRNRQK